MKIWDDIVRLIKGEPTGFGSPEGEVPIPPFEPYQPGYDWSHFDEDRRSKISDIA